MFWPKLNGSVNSVKMNSWAEFFIFPLTLGWWKLRLWRLGCRSDDFGNKNAVNGLSTNKNRRKRPIQKWEGKRKKGRNRERYYISPTFLSAVGLSTCNHFAALFDDWDADKQQLSLHVCKFDVFAYFQSRIDLIQIMRKMCFLTLILMMAMVMMIVMLIAMITYVWTGWLVMSALDEGMIMNRCLLDERYPGWVNKSVSHITQTVNSHSILKWNININFSAMQAKLDLLPTLWSFTNFA